MNLKADTFLSISSNPLTDNGSDLNSMISPTVLLYITLLSIIFVVAALLHLLVRFLLRAQTRLDDAYEGSSTSLFQIQFNPHNSSVDQSFIDALPLFHYNTMIGLRHDPFDCAVCLSEFKAEHELWLLPKCSHAFQVDCIDTWLLTNATCPLCRDNLLLGLTVSSSPVVLVHESDGESSRDSELSLTHLDDVESK